MNMTDITKDNLVELITDIGKQFSKFVIFPYDFYTTVRFYNTKNSASVELTVDNKLLTDYEIDLKTILKIDS
jgi:hypothetical protein